VLLILRVEKFMRERRIKPATLGRHIAGDPRLIFDMRDGRTPGERMKKRIETYMREMGK
jgi:hypothetical protein